MRRRAGQAARDETGVTLIESLVALTIFGICFAVVIGGMSTSVITSDHQRKQANAEALLRKFAEEQKQSYTNCQSTPSTTSTTMIAGVRYTLSYNSITYWDGAAFVTTCTADLGLQRLSLQVVSNDGRASETVQVVKRKQP